MMKEKQLIQRYKAEYGRKDGPMNQDLEEVKNLKSKATVDEFLFRCVCNRKRHQRRIRTKDVENAVRKLKDKIDNLKECADFEELYDTVFNLIGNGNTGISYCTVYDTCIRMSYALKPAILPNEYVYVHRHLIKEANKLLERGFIEDKCRIKRRVFEEKDDAFKDMSSLEIEDYLCVKELLIK